MRFLRNVALFLCLFGVINHADADLAHFSSLHDVNKLLEIWGNHSVENTQVLTPGVDKSAPIFHGSYDWHSSVHSHFAGRFAGQYLQLNSLLQVLDTQYTTAKVNAELRYNSGHEVTYGYPWLLLYASYLLETDDNAYKVLKPLITKAYHAVYARVLGLSFWRYYQSVSSGYENFNFVLLALHRYAQKIDDAKVVEYSANILQAYAPKVQWRHVGAGDFFEPKAIAALAYQEVGLKGVAWDRLQAFYEHSSLSVPVNFFSLPAHKKGRVLSSAWGDWVMYVSTKKTKYLNSFVAKIDIAYQETKPNNDFSGTGHWLPSFGVFALKMVVDSNLPIVDPNPDTGCSLLTGIRVSPEVFVDDIEVTFPSTRDNASVQLQIINWANVIVRRRFFVADKCNQKVTLSGLSSLWAEQYKLKLVVDNKVFYAPIKRRSWWW